MDVQADLCHMIQILGTLQQIFRCPCFFFPDNTNSKPSVWSQGPQCHIWYSPMPSLLYGAKVPSHYIWYTPISSLLYGAKAHSVIIYGTHQFPAFCMEPRPPVSLYTVLINSQPSVWSQGPQCHYIRYSPIPSLLYRAKTPSVIIYGTHQFPAFCIEPRPPVSLYMVLTNSQPSVWSQGPQYHYIRYSPIPSLLYRAKTPSVIIYGTHPFPAFCMEPRPPVSLYTVLTNSQLSVWSQSPQCHYIRYSPIPAFCIEPRPLVSLYTVVTNSQPSVWSQGPQCHYIWYSPIPSLLYGDKAPSVIIDGTHQFPAFCMETRPPVSLQMVLTNSQPSVWRQGPQCHYRWYSPISSLLYGDKAQSVIIYGTHQFPAFCMETRPPVSLYTVLTNSQPSVWSQGPQCHYIRYSLIPSLHYGAKTPSVIIYGTHQFPAFCMEPRPPVSLYMVHTNFQPSVWSQDP